MLFPCNRTILLFVMNNQESKTISRRVLFTGNPVVALVCLSLGRIRILQRTPDWSYSELVRLRRLRFSYRGGSCVISAPSCFRHGLSCCLAVFASLSLFHYPRNLPPTLPRRVQDAHCFFLYMECSRTCRDCLRRSRGVHCCLLFLRKAVKHSCVHVLWCRRRLARMAA